MHCIYNVQTFTLKMSSGSPTYHIAESILSVSQGEEKRNTLLPPEQTEYEMRIPTHAVQTMSQLLMTQWGNND